MASRSWDVRSSQSLEHRQYLIEASDATDRTCCPNDGVVLQPANDFGLDIVETTASPYIVDRICHSCGFRLAHSTRPAIIDSRATFYRRPVFNSTGRKP